MKTSSEVKGNSSISVHRSSCTEAAVACGRKGSRAEGGCPGTHEVVELSRTGSKNCSNVLISEPRWDSRFSIKCLGARKCSPTVGVVFFPDGFQSKTCRRCFCPWFTFWFTVDHQPPVYLQAAWFRPSFLAITTNRTAKNELNRLCPNRGRSSNWDVKYPLVMTNSLLLKIAIFNEFSH